MKTIAERFLRVYTEDKWDIKELQQVWDRHLARCSLYASIAGLEDEIA